MFKPLTLGVLLTSEVRVKTMVRLREMSEPSSGKGFEEVSNEKSANPLCGLSTSTLCVFITKTR